MSTQEFAPRVRLTGRAAMIRPGREKGAVAIITIAAIIIIIGFCGLALDLSQVYNRKMELQNAADVAALAAAGELNGTSTGVSSAVAAAAARFGGSSESSVTFQYGRPIQWAEAAIEFGRTPGGPWVAAGAARNNPGELRYARVSTDGLDPSYSQVNALFIPFFSEDLTIVSMSARAIAGRSAIKVAPLGICAMRPQEKRNRQGELEEYGFRRGVSYDLMNLNPESAGSGLSFLIDPLAPPGATATPASKLSSVEPFVCTGTLAIPRVTGGQITVSSPFPLGTFANHLNSRFKTDAAACNPDAAPPDANVKAYVFNTSVPWMNTARDKQSAAPSQEENKQWTVAGPDPTPAGTTAGMYGPLWSYAKAVQYADPEPSAGYKAYGTSDWSTLYNPGQPKATTGYPSTTPYMQAKGSVTFEAPTGSNKGVRHRRVLNVPLLACPVSGSKASVLGIGRFFMTVPADSTHLYAEFAGLAPEQTLGTHMKLYR
ncbi:pilus assembly protein TadG-related protein [Massilia sp. SYSU DXS3249]